MKTQLAREEFEAYVARRGPNGVLQRPADGLAHLLSFYREVRAEEVDLEADGDMLLYQWGSSGKGASAYFEIDLTRQLIGHGGEDDQIWQLHLTYRFAATEALRGLGNGDRWCALPEELPAFEAFVMSHPALQALGSRDDGEPRIDFQRVG